HASPPAADGGAVAALARVDHPVAVLGAKGALHDGGGGSGDLERRRCRHSLACRATLKRSSSLSRSVVSLISTGRSRTASTTRCWSSSTWKLTRKRRARANSERFSVISMLRESSPRPLAAACLAGPAPGIAARRPSGDEGSGGPAAAELAGGEGAGCIAS